MYHRVSSIPVFGMLPGESWGLPAMLETAVSLCSVPAMTLCRRWRWPRSGARPRGWLGPHRGDVQVLGTPGRYQSSAQLVHTDVMRESD